MINLETSFCCECMFYGLYAMTSCTALAADRSIGRGAFGEVYQGQLLSDEENPTPGHVAVKVSLLLHFGSVFKVQVEWLNNTANTAFIF